MNQPQQVRIIVEDIPGLAASAVLDAAGTLWVVVGEAAVGNGAREAASAAVLQLLGPAGHAAVLAWHGPLIEFGDSCHRFQPAPAVPLLQAAS